MAWYNSNWKYRVKVTVQYSKVGSTLTNFPVYVNLSNLPSGFHANVNQTDARDIRVTKSDGKTELPREVVFYDASTDTGNCTSRQTAFLAQVTQIFIFIMEIVVQRSLLVILLMEEKTFGVIMVLFTT